MRGRRFVGAMGTIAITLLLSAVGTAGGAAAAVQSSLLGAGTVTLTEELFGELAGDRVTFQVQASDTGTGARGRWTVVHIDDAGGLFGFAQGEITCVSVDDGVATVTGVISRAWFRDFPGSAVVGTTAGFTIADEGLQDAIGFDFEFWDNMPVAPCKPVTPFYEVEFGNFIVR